MIAGIESSSTYLTATATSEAVSPERSLANLPPGNDPRVSVPGSPSVVRFSTGGTAIATRSSSHRFRGSALGSAAPPPAVVVAPEPEDPMGLDPALDCPGEVAKLLRCLMGEDFKTLTQALQVGDVLCTPRFLAFYTCPQRRCGNERLLRTPGPLVMQTPFPINSGAAARPPLTLTLIIGSSPRPCPRV